MKIRGIYVYVGIICLAGVAILPLLNWAELLRLSNSDLLGLAALTALGLLSESLALTIRFGGSAGNSSITFLPLLACVQVFGPAAAVLFIAITGTVAEFLIRKKDPLRAYFNIGQYLLSTSLAGLVFQRVGGYPLAHAVAVGQGFSLQILPFIAFGATFLAANHTAVSIAVATDQHKPLGTVLMRMMGSSGTNVLYDILISPIAVAVAFLYVELRVTGLLLVLLPLLFIRHSYLINHKLQRANRDLLKALIKAIETRDPYTSGHSMRVAILARRIGEALGLRRRAVDEIETAALLHDIGKIEGVYVDILRKPASLTLEERRVIESHVTKGVELLHNLASFPRSVLDGVKYHHERIDGNGYPDGLTGSSIPLAARIINVCDAVDAMLSDRPYRRALTLEWVERELVQCAGTHFDAEIVSTVMRANLLQEHATSINSVKRQAPAQAFVVEHVVPAAH